METQGLGVLAALATAALFAAANVYHRRGARHVRGKDATVLTLTVNLVMFVPLGAVYWLWSGPPPLDAATVALYGVIGLFALVFGRIGMYNAIRMVGPSRASAVKNSSPLFTLVLALVILGSMPSAPAMVGVLLILAGVWTYSAERYAPADAALVSPPPSRVALVGATRARIGVQGTGIALGLGVAFSYAVADVFRVLALERVPDVLTATVGVSVAGWLWMVLLMAPRGRLRAVYANTAGEGRRDLVKAGLFMGAGQLMNFVAIALIFVGYVSALIATAPIFTAVLSRIMERHDERFGRAFWFATALLVPGAALINFTG